MGVWLTLAAGAAIVNAVVLLALTGVWVRNYRQFRSKHTLGLALFGVLLLVENLLALYVFAVHPGLHAWLANSAPVAQTAMMLLRLCELAAIGFLAWVTFD
jgi:hypothetical protein